MHGSKVLRFALINAAHNVVKKQLHVQGILRYQDVGRSDTLYALGHCAGKLVRVIHKMLTNKVEFNHG